MLLLGNLWVFGAFPPPFVLGDQMLCLQTQPHSRARRAMLPSPGVGDLGPYCAYMYSETGALEMVWVGGGWRLHWLPRPLL